MARKTNVFAQVARNIRRQADRKIAQLDRIIDNAKDEYMKRGAELRKGAIEKFKAGTYFKGTTEESRRESLQKLAGQLKSTQHVSTRGRRNLASTQTQLNAASVGAASTYTQEQVRIFYRATQSAWQRPGVSLKDRNQAILEYYGYENLSELVSDVLVMNVSAEEAARKYRERMEKLTKEQQEYVTASDVREAQSSPTYLQEVVSMPEPSGLYSPDSDEDESYETE